MKTIGTSETHKSRPGFVFPLVFVLLTAGIVFAGQLYRRRYEMFFRAEVENQLSIVADLKVSELVEWRKERLDDGGVLFMNAAFVSLARQCLEKTPDPDAQRQLLDWMTKLNQHGQYDRVWLLDAQGGTCLSAPEGQPPSLAVLPSDVFRSGRPTLYDFFRSEHDQRIYLAVMIPIFDERDINRQLGVLGLRIDPERYLYPFIKRWPTPSRTAETLLVRREGNEVVFLNELRFETNAALNSRTPLDRVTSPAAQAALGREGIFNGVDYRGVAVVTALRSIPDSPWSLVSRMDAAEAFGPMKAQLRRIVVFIGALLLGVGAFIGLIWWKQTVRSHHAQEEMSEAGRASEVRYRRIFEAVNEGILILNAATGMIVDVNPFLVKLSGDSREAFLDKKVWEVDFFKDLAANPANFEELRQNGYVRSEAMTLESLDGTRRDMEIVSNVCLVNNQQVIQCNIRDISDRLRTQAEIYKLNTELEQRVVARTAQLEAANKELEAFSYSVSHDLRAPLRHVQGYVDMLAREAEGRLSDDGQRYMKTIADASREMGVLIDELLAFSRMGRAEMSDSNVNLDMLVQDTLRDLETTTRERNIVWKIPPLPAVRADPAMLKLALANLLSNAVKFTVPRDPAQIEIGSVGTEDGRVIFFVRDNGVGFDPQYVGKLFGVFQRLHRADEFEGTGIGLANVRRIIARHGGRTWAEGVLDHGATFYFTLKPSSSANPPN